MPFFPEISTNFVDWNGRKVNNERMCCLVGFCKEINAVFQVKMFKIKTENDKNPKIFQIPKFLCIFSTFLTNYVNWNNEKDQQVKNVLSKRLFRRVKYCLLSGNVSNQHRKLQRTQTFSIFKNFMHFLLMICQNSWIEMF